METKIKQPTVEEQIERLKIFALQIEVWQYRNKRRLAGIRQKIEHLEFEMTR